MVGMGKFIYILVFLFMINLSCINFYNIIGYIGILISLRIIEIWNILIEFSMFGKINIMN